MVSGTAPSIYSLAFDVLLFALLIMMLHTTQRNQSGNKHAKLLLRHLVRNVLSILVEGNHQCAGDGGFHHAGSDSLEKARHALLLPITRLRSGHFEDCLHDAEGGKRLSGPHLLLRLHHVEWVHEEGRQRSSRRSADEALGRPRQVRLLHHRARLLQTTFHPRTRASHQPVEGGEGDVAQEVRVDALPEVQHAVDAGFAAHALDRSDQTAGQMPTGPGPGSSKTPAAPRRRRRGRGRGRR